MAKPIPVFYNENMIAVKPGLTSPGLWKARDLMRLIESEPEFAKHADFNKVTRDELRTAHSKSYIDGVLELAITNGHGTRLPEDLEAILWQNGSYLAAVEHAAKNKTVAFSPTSGFHHAGWEYGGGYCTFNALMVAAHRCAVEYDMPVLIIDGDAHFGDGCVDILQRTDASQNVQYITTSRYDNPTDFILRVIGALGYHGGIVLYQAGADCHESDNLHGGNYTTQQMAQRDCAIFGACKEKGLPLVWNLAGGYGAPGIHDTLLLHYNTWKEAVAAYCS